MPDTDVHPLGTSPPLAGSDVNLGTLDGVMSTEGTSNNDEGCAKNSDNESEPMETDEKDKALDLTPVTKKMKKKRKTEHDLELSVVLSEGMDRFLAEVDKLCNETWLMSTLMDKNINTKTEIKEKVRFMAKLATRVKKSKEQIIFRAPIKSFDFKDAPSAPNIPKGSTLPWKDSDGTVYCEKCKTEIGKEKKIIQEIKLEIVAIKESREFDPERLAVLIKMDWPEEVYTSTEVKIGRITQEPLVNTKIVLMSAGETERIIQGAAPNWIEKLTGQYGLLEKICTRKNVPFMCEKLSTLTALGEDAEKPEKSRVVVMVTEKTEYGRRIRRTVQSLPDHWK